MTYSLRACLSHPADRLLRVVDIIGIAAAQSKDLAGRQEGLGGPVRQRLGKGLRGDCDDRCDGDFLHLRMTEFVLFRFVEVGVVLLVAWPDGPWGSLELVYRWSESEMWARVLK